MSVASVKSGSGGVVPESGAVVSKVTTKGTGEAIDSLPAASFNVA